MDDVAREAGISKGLSFWYFRSKDALVEAILEHLLEQDALGMEAVANTPGPVRKRILDYVKAQDGEIRRFSTVMPLVYEFYARIMRSQRVRKLVRDSHRRQKKAIIAIIRQGIRSGELATSNPDAVAEMFLALSEGIFLRWTAEPDDRHWQERAQFAVRLILDGIRAPAKPSRRPKKARSGH